MATCRAWAVLWVAAWAVPAAATEGTSRKGRAAAAAAVMRAARATGVNLGGLAWW